MSSEKFDIFVNLRDRASDRLKRIGAAGLRMGKNIAQGVAGALRRLTSLQSLLLGGGIVAAIAKVTKANWEQVRSNVSLGLAIARQGMSAKEVLPILQKYAQYLQKITTIGDEVSQRIMALGMNMGVSAGQIMEAYKAAIGLSKGLEIDLQGAMKLVAKAAAGQTSELSRYGIVIDQSLSKQQKFNYVLKMGGDLFVNATKETEETYGAFEQFKNAAGDLQERIGAVIDRVFDLGDKFRTLRDWIEEINTSAFETWLENVRDKAYLAAKGIAEIFKGGEGSQLVMRGFGKILKGVFQSAASAAVSILAKAAPAIGHAIGSAIDFGGTRLGVRSTAKSEVMKRMLREEEERTGEKPHYLAHTGISLTGEYKRRVEEEFDKLWRQEMADRGQKVAASMGADPGADTIAAGFRDIEAGVGEDKPRISQRALNENRLEALRNELVPIYQDKSFYERLDYYGIDDKIAALNEYVKKMQKIEEVTPEGERGAVQLRIRKAADMRQGLITEAEEQASTRAASATAHREAIWKMKYQEADDETRKRMLVGRGAELRKAYSEAEVGDKAAIFEQILAARSEFHNLMVGGKTDKPEDEPDSKTADLREQLSEMNRRQTQEIGVREYFRYMQNLRQGRAPDEETAANTREMVRLLEELARAEGLR